MKGKTWNLCFSSGTVLLTSCYEPRDAVRVQGVNDLVIFGVAGVGSFASGYVFSWLGWRALVLVVTGVMGLAALFVAASLALRGPQTAAAAAAADAAGTEVVDEPAYAPLAAGGEGGEGEK